MATRPRGIRSSASATPSSVPFKTDRKPTATPTTPKTPATCSTSIIPSSLKSIFLYDWWLVKANDGEGLAIGGFASRERSGIRAFYSAAISKRHETTILEATDGIIISISGFINRPRTHENGFPPKVYNHFLLGFPFNWKDYMSSGSIRKSTVEFFKASTSRSNDQGTSHYLEPDLDNLAVTRLRDLCLSTYGESSHGHDLFMKNSNSSCCPTQSFSNEGKNDDVIKDSLHARQEAKKLDIDLQIRRGQGVCTRSMTKLKNTRNRSKESLISDSRKKKKSRK
ncbi:uncharacterized protein LOC101215879 [Cucumis sativus]|uniref:uncharacterized protein LOC101215879 n=1 Tax=Cucumis sativus TaxID=3659 RepID=UPI0002B4D434|nr:uncharacterized protein LOC101215879 [Cucumis sativus]KAE8649115.1 hypothetical protein Csa_014544 [Cucumis sativus]